MKTAEQKNLALFGIAQELTALNDLIAQDGGEITPEIEALQKEVFDIMENKTDNFVGFITMMESEIVAADSRIDALKAFKTSRKNAIERSKLYAADCLRTADKTSFRGPMSEIKMRKPTKVLNIIDEDKVPIKFLEMIPATTKVKNADLLKAVKNGEISESIAVVVDGKVSVSFKLKTVG